MSKQKDTDYLFISTRLRSLENRLLTRERMERMLEARSNEDAAKVLSECGYDGLEPLSAAALERSLAANRRDTFAELSSMSPNPGIVDVFRMKYDYHNAKALVKCLATNQDPQRLLIDAGRVSADKFREMVQRGELSDLPDSLRKGIEEAQEKLSATGDPQRCDFTLDLYYYEELKQVAKSSGSSFLQGYVRLMIDAANLKAAVRLLRMKKGHRAVRHRPDGGRQRQQDQCGRRGRHRQRPGSRVHGRPPGGRLSGRRHCQGRPPDRLREGLRRRPERLSPVQPFDPLRGLRAGGLRCRQGERDHRRPDHPQRTALGRARRIYPRKAA